MPSKTTNVILIFSGTVIILLFLFVPIPVIEPQPSMGVPAEFGDTSVEEMIVVNEPVSMFCKIYPTAQSCR